jgi:signal transduction histidine kinase/DNA-binding NarL/FixJ family response regulator
MKSNNKVKQEWQISLETKIALAVASMISVSIVLATGASLYQSQKIFYQELQQQAEVLLTAFELSAAHSLSFNEIESLGDIVERLSTEKTIIAARVYRADGRIIADSGRQQNELTSQPEDSLGLKIIQNQTVFFDWQPHHPIAGKPIIVENRILGAIALELSTTPLQQKLTAERHQSLIVAAIAIVITSLIAFCFSRSITEPLKQMITATQYIAGGDFSHEMEVSSNDEFATLARTFNFMTSELRKTVKDLELRAEALHQSETQTAKKALQLKITLDRLKQAKVAAERANQAKSVFLSNMSHELRTPLNGILGYAQILRRDRHLSLQQSHGLKIIYDSGNHLLTLINDILDLSKIEARKLELYPNPIHSQSFFNSIADLIRMQALEKDILFECVLSPDLPIGIQADEKRLRQVLLNFLGNALKFTDRGKITLSVSTIPAKATDNSNSKAIHFEVSDTGVGIAPQQLDRIFQPFKQVGNIKRRETGTGLGLAISTQLVTLMGGQIGVKSQLGQGSSFWFDATFPVDDCAITYYQSEQKKRIIGYKGQKRKILVVDDKEENRLVILNMLEPLGFEIILAQDGQQEIDLARQIQPDCILTDLVMPVKTGFEAVREIRQIPEIKDVIIIAISASVLDTDRQKSRIVGCEAFLPKPIQEQQLLLLLQTYLKLDWIYEETETSLNLPPATAPPSPQKLIAPPTEEVEILYELAMLGSMKKIRERADYLAELDGKYLPFARKIQNLAQKFQEKAIVKLIEEFL